ncbi:M28 family metallopeptidase [Aquimarina sp. 2201CG14-23]|uniref:M28 family metallopeptidase n=1 Tax=Aquimarina mycalae TaxID=3040073 RepID=UPI00247819B8|nr:M20/M25/M40 family metallo-hydrolase [Aquimarina sp. 2201CG14-23]MDH7446122.1 M20/M25/M40 family metallo-hydrolase [Aquimarina sp. 2201CG14-23]
MKHQMLLYLLGIFLFSYNINGQSLDVHTKEQLTLIQKKLIAKLSGTTSIKGSNILAVRSSSSERKIAADFLGESLQNISLTPEKHKYKLPNEFFLIDLLFDPYKGTNIYTIIPATIESDEYIILGAHYDSEPYAPGADDNASGVALIYAVAYQISQLTHRSKNFMIVFFDQEEENEIGSKAFAKKIQQEGKNIHSVHIADMVGWDSDNNGMITLSPPIDDILSIYNLIARSLSIPIQPRNLMSSDHKSFYDLGYPAVLISEEFSNSDFNSNYHSPKDTYNTINFEYLANNTEMVYLVMEQLAKN